MASDKLAYSPDNILDSAAALSSRTPPRPLAALAKVVVVGSTPSRGTALDNSSSSDRSGTAAAPPPLAPGTGPGSIGIARVGGPVQPYRQVPKGPSRWRELAASDFPVFVTETVSSNCPVPITAFQ